MNTDEHPVRPSLADHTGDAMKGQQLHNVTLWCTSGDPAHWITSYKFSSTVPGFDGISIDMYQPKAHVDTPANVENYLGSVKIEARPSNRLMSRMSPIYKTIDFKVTVTVLDVINTITANSLHLYRFHPQGCGCMHWQLTLLQAFARAGWIGNADVQSIYDSISTLSTSSRVSIPFPPVQGEFYRR